ncbi:MAG: polysaccharide deacetylase family protein [Armatimonadetes bacterium]|nr:polysaccharide deacetylase family protein [Armatimonadota bacterium]
MRLTDLSVILALSVGGSWTAVHSPGDQATAPPSHLRPHLVDHAPPALLVPLENGSPGVLKGWDEPIEALLARELRKSGLSERLVKVGVMQAGGLRLAVVKLQAGVWRTGRFSVARLTSDCEQVLKACFSPQVHCDHVDLWAAVPYEGPDGIKWHWPVFSMSCWRDNYAAAAPRNLHGLALLRQLSMLRFDPLFLKYAADAADVQGPEIFDLPVPRLDGWSFDARSERVSGRLHVLQSGARSSRYVAITIDDGPHPATTSLMLHFLAQQRARVTFFVVGEKILHYPQLLLDIVGAGHEVGDHCFTNRRLPKLSLNAVAAELGETARLIELLTKSPCRLMRPPGGDVDVRSLELCGALGLMPVFWSRNTGDWRDIPAASIAAAALDGVKGGDIILMHQGRIESALALREILAGLRRKGLQPGRISDLLPDAPLLSGNARQILERLRAAGCLREE